MAPLRPPIRKIQLKMTIFWKEAISKFKNIGPIELKKNLPPLNFCRNAEKHTFTRLREGYLRSHGVTEKRKITHIIEEVLRNI